jgi:hypothetical protein
VRVLAEHERRAQFLFICLREAINWAAGTLFDKNVNWIERDMSYDPPASLFGELLTSSAPFGEVKISIANFVLAQIFICIYLLLLNSFFCITSHVSKFILTNVSSCIKNIHAGKGSHIKRA